MNSEQLRHVSFSFPHSLLSHSWKGSPFSDIFWRTEVELSSHILGSMHPRNFYIISNGFTMIPVTPTKTWRESVCVWGWGGHGYIAHFQGVVISCAWFTDFSKLTTLKVQASIFLIKTKQKKLHKLGLSVKNWPLKCSLKFTNMLLELHCIILRNVLNILVSSLNYRSESNYCIQRHRFVTQCVLQLQKTPFQSKIQYLGKIIENILKTNHLRHSKAK